MFGRKECVQLFTRRPSAIMRARHLTHRENPTMYVSLLRLYVEVSQQSPILYIGLIVLLMASWSLIVSAVVDIVIKAFDVSE